MAHLYKCIQQPSDDNKDKLREFNNWLDKLSLEEMLHAMEFTLLPDEHSASDMEPFSGKLSPKSHELELLEQMISLQSPPPTPIHPRVLQGMKLSTKYCVTDGKDEEQRVYKNRFRIPRLFQLSERPQQGTTNLNELEFSDTYSKNLDIPPEIAALIAADASRSIGKKKRAMKKRQSNSGKKYYDVIARKAVTSWGQILSVGCTKEQQMADKKILLGTSIKYGCSTARGVTNKSNGNIFHSCMFWWHSEECLSIKRGKPKSSAKSEILRMMKIVSRGKFLSTPPSVSNTANSQFDYIFYSEWLNPELEWFSLPMYLASRFEIALWQSFYKIKKCNSSKPDQNIAYIEEMTKSFSVERISNVIVQATRAIFLKKILQEDYKSGKFRDMMIWKLLCYKCINQCREIIFDSNNISKYLLSIPLIEYSSTKDKLRIMVLEKLEMFLSREAETQVLKCIEKECNKDQKSRNEKARNSRRKKSKKKRGKFRIKNVSLAILDPIHESNNSNLGACSSLTTGNEIEKCNLLTISNPTGTNSLTKEQNRSTVMVLGIIEDVLHRSFEKLGFQAEMDDGYKTKLTCHDRIIRKNVIESNTLNGNETGNKKVSKKSFKYSEEDNQNQLSKDPPSTSTLLNPEQQNNISINQLTLRRSNLTHAVDVSRNVHEVNKKSIKSVNITNAEDGKISSYQPSLSQIENIQSKQTSSHQHLFPFFHHQNTEVEKPDYETQYNRDFFDKNFPIGLSLDLSSSFGWDETQQQNNGRQKSLFADFFQKDEGENEINEQLIASSTAASIASSSTIFSSSDELKDINAVEPVAFNELMNEENKVSVGLAYDDDDSLPASECVHYKNEKQGIATSSIKNVSKAMTSHSKENCDIGLSYSLSQLQNSPLSKSPILVSLADLRDLRKRSSAEKLLGRKLDETLEDEKFPKPFAGSLPSSPKSNVQPKTMIPSWSREDLRIPNIKVEGHFINRKPNCSFLTPDSTLSYRNAALKNLTKAESTCSHEARICETVESIASTNRKMTVESLKPSKEIIIDGHINSHIDINTCAQSDSALEAHEDSSHWNVIPRSNGQVEADHDETTRDGATTISTVPSPTDHEELRTLREERNAYKDMCLTLAAEVSKLKNLLAAEKGKAMSSFVHYSSQSLHSPYHHTSPYHPKFMPMLFHNIRTGSTRTVAAMSDLGINNDAPMSDAESTTDTNCKIWKNQTDYISHQRQVANSGTQAGGTNAPSDAASSEHATVAWSAVSLTTLRHQHHEAFMSEHNHGMQSRLSKDIQCFMQSITSKLKKQESIRAIAIKRLTQLVTALWPRAQVKIYGSHVNNLCLPSSDLDFVVCLPAVHKNAPAEAPGVLEGRNAINESKQKLLARKLKLESWIDPRSIKIIERTIVPVIKVSTKDTRARVLQLDITFDAPEHHGLQAIVMVANILEEFPLIRPIMLVLKQFLLDRGLLTAYSGGISSYGLFLMVTRYLQEQATSWVDCGSLLMGFLDFYGNSFDPRSTGISVARRQYFPRSSDAYVAANQNPHVWNSHQQQSLPVPPVLHQQHPINTKPPVSNKDLMRRHSFTDSARSVSSGGGSTKTSTSTFHKYAAIPSRFQFARPTNQKNFIPQSQRIPHHQIDSNLVAGRPFSFDPLFIEDPISPLNNVGRNSFRIFQVKRAFSDAHRALVASLEWDMNSTECFSDIDDYPLLKCLLQSEDVFFLDIDDHK